MSPTRSLVLTAVILLAGVQATSARASDAWRRTNEFASGTGTYLFVGLGIVAPLLEDGSDGPEHSLRIASSVLVSSLICEGLKRVTHEQRPDASDARSFPSGHATAAFSVAEMQRQLHPSQGWAWYAGATLIAESRVFLKRHYWWDSVAGAALGFGVARYGFPIEQDNTTHEASPRLTERQPGRPWLSYSSIPAGVPPGPQRLLETRSQPSSIAELSQGAGRRDSPRWKDLALVPVVSVHQDGGYLGLKVKF